MKKICLGTAFFIFTCALTFAADSIEVYKESIKRWGDNPLARKLQKKITQNNLDIDDVQEILAKGSFPYNKKVHGLKKVSEGKKTVSMNYETKFAAKIFLLPFQVDH